MTKIFTRFFQLLYRLWFYILVTIPIVIFFPVLLIVSSSERLYPQFFWIARNIWANFILYGMFFIPSVKKEQKLEKGKSYMLIANHTSMADIMLMLKVSKNPFVFVGKRELAKIPIFGFFYKRVCILVDRSSASSRTAVYKSAQRRLKQGLSVCIFPEGGVPDDTAVVLDEFKDGAFRLAIEHEIPIVPIVFLDNKKRFSYEFFSGSPGKMRARVLPFIETKGLGSSHGTEIKKQARTLIFNRLTKKIPSREKGI
ncbi:lysophospholipid acyltransferase family protein [Galbibacter pacificus]|uniref:Lysophospholipid acyltransferase family protein n=1 Tax=Galbibacter pacificus TaxID=2996052 RepID=A0ABT6FU41_9FLAO|nr:lysophospholipid acyltransferase family protein [Galbibacter pacificus]MDG3583312.1 lysophospholipid acyltransferase family protein [Galbibacter pacificus]MDG3586793.1 lysophospholipid acyltransferase family protein [Galbibacter pacificus]